MSQVVSRALVVALAFAGFGAASAGAQACTKAWGVGSGSWTDAAAWIPPGMPGPNDDVCISAHGTYTVTVPVLNGGAQVRTLTVGALAGGGQQTLLILGQSAPLGGGTLSGTVVNASAGGSTTPIGRIVLDATDQGIPVAPNTQAGGPATLSGGAFTNYGSVVAQSESLQQFRDYLRVPFTNASGGTVEVTTGFLDYTGGLTFQNDGTLTSDGNGWFQLESDLPLATGAQTKLVNTGVVANNGRMEVDNASWTQAGGSVTGAALRMLNGALDYQAGTGSFDMNEGFGTPHSSLSGTIPAGQTVTARGGSFGSPGNSHSWTLELAGAQVVNRGTLQLAAVSGTSQFAGSVSVEGAPLVNYGTIRATSAPDGSGAAAPSPAYLRTDLTNAPGGVVDVEAVLAQDFGTVTLNQGTIALSAGAVYSVTRSSLAPAASTFTNAPDGIVTMTLDGSSVPVFAISSGATFNANGALVPVLGGSFVPRQGQEFRLLVLAEGNAVGRFSAIGSGFSPDYTHAGYVGAIYGTIVGPFTAGRGSLVVRLTCPPGDLSCPKAIVKATALERVRVTTGKGKHKKTHLRTRRIVVASSSGTIAAGRTRTFTLKLNRAGRRVLAHAPGRLSVRVVVTSGGRTLATRSVHVLRL